LTEDKTLVSVVVPCLNSLDFLPAALDSIFAQDYSAIECIVVDGGSTDGTLELLESYGERLRWLSRPDNGAFDAINDGFKLSHGSILAWLNADDTWAVPHAVSDAVAYFTAHPEVDVVYGECGGIDSAGTLIWYGAAKPWDLSNAVLTCDAVIHQPAAFFRRSIMERVDWVYPAWAHDHDLWVRISLAGGNLQPLAKHLGNARIWKGNLHMVYDTIVPAKLGLTQRALADERLPPEVRRQRGRTLSNAYVRCLDFLARPSQWHRSLQLVWHAFRASPGNWRHILTQVIVHMLWLVPPVRPLLWRRYGHGVALKRGSAPPVGFSEYWP
jgi:glycosyltransferase involved in cell wall biosynthesis